MIIRTLAIFAFIIFSATIHAYNVYATNVVSGTISIIDTDTNTISDTFDCNLQFPTSIIFTPNAQHFYLCNLMPKFQVSAFNTATHEILASIPVDPSFPSNEFAMTPDGATLYVTNNTTQTITVIDTSSNTITNTIAVGQGIGIAISPDGSSVYVPNKNLNNISVIDTTTNTITSTIPGITSGVAIAITPDGTLAYVADSEDELLYVVDLAAESVVTTIPVSPLDYAQIAMTSNRAYMTNFDIVTVLDTSSHTVVTTIPVGSYPYCVVVTPDEQYVYVGNMTTMNVSVISTTTNTVVATIPLPTSKKPAPFGLALEP